MQKHTEAIQAVDQPMSLHTNRYINYTAHTGFHLGSSALAHVTALSDISVFCDTSQVCAGPVCGRQCRGS